MNYYVNNDMNSFFQLRSLGNIISEQALEVELLNAAIFHFTNQQRHANKIPKCKFSLSLADSSKLHSIRMKTHDFFGHENPKEPSYRTLADRINAIHADCNGKFSCFGENIADFPIVKSPGDRNKFMVRNSSTVNQYYSRDGLTEIPKFTYEEFAQGVVQGWMDSPGHRSNILNRAFKYLGCGVAYYIKEVGSKTSHIPYCKITQNFGGELIKSKHPFQDISFTKIC